QVSAIWYDRRLDTGLSLTDVFLAQSNDGGVSFIPNVRVTDTSSNWVTTNSDAFPNFGDYINTTADGSAIYATWADGRNGDPDVFFSKVGTNGGLDCTHAFASPGTLSRPNHKYAKVAVQGVTDANGDPVPAAIT